MTPLFHILANGQDITANIQDRFLSLTLSDRAGLHADIVEIRLDDREGRIELPNKGAELDVSIGYKEQGLVHMGLYTVDEIELSGPPDALIIRAKAANMLSALKEHKTRSWDEKTLGDVLGVIAAEHQLELRVGESLTNISIAHLDQTEESDMHLLTRLAKQYDAVTKPAGGCLLFVPKGEAKSATGKAIPAVSISRYQTSGHRITLADRSHYSSVRAHWHDIAIGERKKVEIGDGNPVYILRHNYPDADTARAAAQGKLNALSRGLGTASLTLAQGNPLLAAEAKLTLSGFTTGIDGDWIATQVDHEFSNNGYSTHVEAETRICD
jgi:phage protein D